MSRMTVGERSVNWWGTLLVGLLAAAVSLGRLLIVTPTALTDLLWAEDGLFPLCVRKAGPIACTLDPFAGYLLFVPRAIAAAIAPLPLGWWPAAANLAAAGLAGAAAAIAYAVVRKRGASLAASALVAMILVAAPIVGVEGINVYASSYMPLLYAATIALAFPPQTRFPLWAYGIGLLLTALTIPSAILLVVPIAIQMARRSLSVRNAVVLAAVIVVGLLGQFFTALASNGQRLIEVNGETFTNWLNAVPQSMATFVPGLNVSASTDAFGMAQLNATPWFGGLVVLLLTVVGVWLAARGTEPWSPGYGLMILMGLGIGAIPSVTGYVSNRYFVVPALLWFAVVLLVIDGGVRKTRRPWLAWVLVTAITIALWWPSLPAAGVRATPNPPWSQNMRDYEHGCEVDPNLEIVVGFSPYAWPQKGGPEITSASIRCPDLRP